MTSTHRFEASFRDLAVAVGLNYRKMKKGRLVASLPMQLAGKMPKLYY